MGYVVNYIVKYTTNVQYMLSFFGNTKENRI